MANGAIVGDARPVPAIVIAVMTAEAPRIVIVADVVRMCPPPGWVTGIRAVGFTRRPHIRPPAGSGPLRRVRGEKAPERRTVARSKAGGGVPAPPYTSLYRRAVCSTGTWRWSEVRRRDGRISCPRADRARWEPPPESGRRRPARTAGRGRPAGFPGWEVLSCHAAFPRHTHCTD